MKRIGIFGGSFDPVHRGHISAAKFAREKLRLDEVLMIPCCESPYKDEREHTPTPEQRLQMLRLAVQGSDGFVAASLEIDRGGKSYTADTVAQLHRQYPDAQLFLCLGADKLENIVNWKGADEFLPQVTLAVFPRGGKGESEKLAKAASNLRGSGIRVEVLESPVVEISSTDLRRLLVFDCAGAFLPRNVEDYIRTHGLYGTGRSYRRLRMDDLEQVVVSLLKPNRVRHVLGCRDTAAELAKIWGADVTDAARAGLLHDITKALDGPLQLELCRSYGAPLDAFSRQNPKTLHALTGSLVAQRIFGESEAVVSAICSHTTGKADMNTLEKIIYVADYMEPNRDFPGVEELRRLAHSDLTAALKLGLEMTLKVLLEQGREVSPGSREALEYLNTTP